MAAGRRSSQSVPDAYDLTASSWIGAIETPTVSLVVQPKFDIDNVMFLISYALDPIRWQHLVFHHSVSGGALSSRSFPHS